MIRKATIDDIPVMLNMANYHLANSSYARVNFDPTKTADFLEDLFNDNGFALVSVHDGKVVGGMVGDIITPWFSHDKIGIEHIIYMSPDHRSGRDVYQMIRSWIEWCKHNEVKQIRPQITSGNLKVSRLYEAMGFTITGNNFVLEV